MGKVLKKKKPTMFDFGVRLLAIVILGYVGVKSLGRIDLGDIGSLHSPNSYITSTSVERVSSLLDSASIACKQAGGERELIRACLGLIGVAESQLSKSENGVSLSDKKLLLDRVAHLNRLYKN